MSRFIFKDGDDPPKAGATRLGDMSFFSSGSLDFLARRLARDCHAHHHHHQLLWLVARRQAPALPFARRCPVLDLWLSPSGMKHNERLPFDLVRRFSLSLSSLSLSPALKLRPPPVPQHGPALPLWTDRGNYSKEGAGLTHRLSCSSNLLSRGPSHKGTKTNPWLLPPSLASPISLVPVP